MGPLLWLATTIVALLLRIYWKSVKATGAENVGRSSDGAQEPVLLVDFNNVRGVDGFTHTSACFVALLSAWAMQCGLARGRVFCYIDHGTHFAVRPFGPLVLVFAGPNRTADDAIVADVRFFLAQRGCAVLVATNDRQLRQRCTRAAVVLGGRMDARAKGGAKKAGRARRKGTPLRLVSSDSLLAAVGPVSTPLPSVLARLGAVEACLRRHTPSSVDASTGAFAERTWVRVLAGALLQHATRPKAKAGRAANEEGQQATARGCAGATLRPLKGMASTVPGPDAARARAQLVLDLAERHGSRSVPAKAGRAHTPLLRDHRIARDRGQQKAIRDFVAGCTRCTDTEGGHEDRCRAAGGDDQRLDLNAWLDSPAGEFTCAQHCNCPC
jgi:hypothetical protein